MSNWKDMFKPFILERGEEYYDCGYVEMLDSEEPLIQALVLGSQVYQVNIQKTGGHVSSMHCNCPYARKGENCKHMAAVLYALEEEKSDPQVDWQSALAQMPEKKLRELLASLAAEDRNLQERIVRGVSGPGSSPQQWQDALKRIISKYVDSYGWIDNDMDCRCMEEMAQYLEESLSWLLESGRVMDATRLVLTVYDVAFSQEIDDSYDGLEILSSSCNWAVEQVLAQANPRQEMDIFRMLIKAIEDEESTYETDDLEDIVSTQVWSRAVQQEYLKWLDKNIDYWHMKQRADLMEKMGASKAEIIAWWEQYRETDAGYHALLKLYSEAEPRKAAELVRERRKQADNDQSVVEYTKTLIGLLDKAADSAEYGSELRYLVLELNCQEPGYVMQLKAAVTSEQWDEIFESLLAAAQSPAGRMSLYSIEGMCSQLFAELEQAQSFERFTSYKDQLCSWDAKRTLKLYIELLKQQMKMACVRDQYRNVIWHLKELKAYPNGKEEAKKLADYWYEHHKNRPAMKDELKKAGYR